ncbi:uncharacterized protein LOC143997906 [Lithobates pipiens]
MKTLVALLFLGSLGLAWCCSPPPGATNIARSGEASQSSNYGSTAALKGFANKAIDGVNDQNWYNGFCSHTGADRSPWWRLDLKQKYKVNVVVVSSRSDCCLGRMRDLEVRIGNSPDNNNPVCGKITRASSAKITFCCNGMEGQYVSVVIPGRNEYLSLCEVEVYGDPATQEKRICCGQDQRIVICVDYADLKGWVSNVLNCNKLDEPAESCDFMPIERLLTDSLCLGFASRMKTLVALLFLGSLGLAWCCSPPPGATNIARSGEASESSVLMVDPIGYAYKANDGVTDTNWFHGSCTHTNADLSPWWKVDLKQKYKVNVVVVTGRSDNAMGRLMGAEVRIGNSPDNNNPVCGKVTQVSDATTIFCCNGMEGQYVSVVIPGRSEYLTLCEVEVYGDLVAQENHVCW